MASSLGVGGITEDLMSTRILRCMYLLMREVLVLILEKVTFKGVISSDFYDYTIRLKKGVLRLVAGVVMRD